MNLETSSFNLEITNLFIGLFDNNILLRPHSQAIYELGYSIHSIEPKFNSQGNTINPEAIACSSSKHHTLLTEWTNAKELSSEKKEQISNYLRIEQSDLVNNAKISQDACNFYSLWVVVSPKSLDSFQEIIEIANNNLTLCCFGKMPTGEYFINFHSGDVLDPKLSSIITQNMKFARIPNSYIPIPFDDLTNKKFTDGVFQEIVSFYIKQRHEFSIKDICQAMFIIWRYLGTEKQKAIQNAVKRVMLRISQIPIKTNEDWLVYNKDFSQWEIRNLSKQNFDKICNYMQSNKISFYE